MAKRKSDGERELAIQKLRSWLKPGDTVYTIFRHVSRSGMQRRLSVVLLQSDAAGNGIVDLHPNHAVAKATGFRLHRNSHDEIVVGGYGMDVGFEVVYNLGRVLWPDSFDCIGEGCPANDHLNGDTDYTPHRHTDGGYALRHRWL